MSLRAAVTLLISVTVLVAVTADFLVTSIDGMVENTSLSQQWLGLVLLPVAANAAELVLTASGGVHDQLDAIISVALDSSIQLALSVVPAVVLISWMAGKVSRFPRGYTLC